MAMTLTAARKPELKSMSLPTADEALPPVFPGAGGGGPDFPVMAQIGLAEPRQRIYRSLFCQGHFVRGTVMTRYRGILFDKDGTLFSFAGTWSVWARRLFLELTGGDVVGATRLGAIVGFDFEACSFMRDSVVIAGTPGEIADAIHPHAPEYSRDGLLERMNRLAAGAPLAQVVDLPALLGRLADCGLRLGVATNDAEAPARANIAQLGVTDRFDFIAGFDSGHGAKPEPGMLLAFARTFGLDPADCVMVGDSTHDLLAARAAGMAGVAVLTGIADRDELSPCADAVLPDIGHLPGWLGLHEAG